MDQGTRAKMRGVEPSSDDSVFLPTNEHLRTWTAFLQCNVDRWKTTRQTNSLYCRIMDPLFCSLFAFACSKCERQNTPTGYIFQSGPNDLNGEEIDRINPFLEVTALAPSFGGARSLPSFREDARFKHSSCARLSVDINCTVDGER
jgi:hypothetical protein